MALACFSWTIVGVFIPYVTKAFKNVRHTCRNCGTLLVTVHYGTGAEAHLV